MKQPKNRKYKISDLKKALEAFEAEHGDIEVLLTTDLESVNIGGNKSHFYDR